MNRAGGRGGSSAAGARSDSLTCLTQETLNVGWALSDAGSFRQTDHPIDLERTHGSRSQLPGFGLERRVPGGQSDLLSQLMVTEHEESHRRGAMYHPRERTTV